MASSPRPMAKASTSSAATNWKSRAPNPAVFRAIGVKISFSPCSPAAASCATNSPPAAGSPKPISTAKSGNSSPSAPATPTTSPSIAMATFSASTPTWSGTPACRGIAPRASVSCKSAANSAGAPAARNSRCAGKTACRPSSILAPARPPESPLATEPSSPPNSKTPSTSVIGATAKCMPCTSLQTAQATPEQRRNS